MRLASTVLALAGCTGGNTETFKRQGRIQIEQGTIDGMSFATAGALFTDALVWGEPLASDGPCTLYSPAPSNQFSAGQIDITGANQPITLAPQGTDPSVFYAPVAQPTFPTFAAGNSLSAKATGASGPLDLQGFDLGLTAPAPVTGFIAPSMVSRSGTTVTWDAGSNPRNWILVDIEADVQVTVLQIVCDTDDSGMFTLPASTLALIPQGASAALLVVSHVRVTSRIVSDTRVELDVVETAGSSVLPVAP